MKLNVLITGGAGFIGSHLVDTFITKGANVCVIDDLSSGRLENIKRWLKMPHFTFVCSNLLKHNNLSKIVRNYEILFHLAANPEVRVGLMSPNIHFNQNVVATFKLLEAIRKSDNVKVFLFTSSSTVYGEASYIPTPESYAPLKPISVYGATKLACEALLTAYSHTYGFRAIIYRLANVIGPRSTHGVLYDFIQKLRRNPKELEILGDGTQTKSYLHVTDCIKAMLVGLEKSRKPIEIFNVGSEDQIDVKTIAKIVIEEMALQGVKIIFTGGIEGKGWKGDVKNMLLDISKLKTLGWKPELNSEQAIRQTTREILDTASIGMK